MRLVEDKLSFIRTLSVMASTSRKARRKKKQDDEKPAEKKPDLHDDDIVQVTTKYGMKKLVTRAEARYIEHQRKLDLQQDAALGKPPAPCRPRCVKKSYDRATFQINWNPPDQYCRVDQIEAAILSWNYARKKESLYFEDHSTEMENIGVHLYKHQAEQETEKKIVNKRARNITVNNLVPGRKYEFRLRFAYDMSVNPEMYDKTTEGLESFPVEVKLPMRILSCNNCGATLLWGLESCPKCAGEMATHMAWAKKKGGKVYQT